MKTFVNDSAKESQAGDPIKTEPFLLDSETENAPSFFEIVFILNKVRYRYGFEVTTKEVVSEWLYHTPNKKESYLFTRDKQKIKINRGFSEGKGLQERTRNNTLFLSVISQFNGKISSRIVEWLDNYEVFSGKQKRKYSSWSRIMLQDREISTVKDKLIQLVKTLDLGINNIEFQRQSQTRKEVMNSFKRDLDFNRFLDILKNEHEEFEVNKIITLHTKYKNRKSIGNITFDLEEQESDGTQKLFAIASVLMFAMLTGELLAIDEIDARFHPQSRCI